jgi:hypothetical protein
MPPYNLEMKVQERKGEIMELKKVEGELQIDEKTRFLLNGKSIVTRPEFFLRSFVVTEAGDGLCERGTAIGRRPQMVEDLTDGLRRDCRLEACGRPELAPVSF